MQVEVIQFILDEIIKAIEDLMSHPSASSRFNQPVDERNDRAPGYYNRVSKPQNLGSIRNQLQRGHYEKNLMDVNEDVCQVTTDWLIHVTLPLCVSPIQRGVRLPAAR